MHSHKLLVQDLTVSYHRIPALHHLNFEVACGQSIALVGPNGAGKSTLLKTLAGLIPKETGGISFHGKVLHGPTRDLAYLPQREQVDWDFPTTVRGIVEMGRYLRLSWWRRYTKADEEAVEEAIDAMQLKALEDRQINALSGGQQQRAFLARALAQEAHVVLLDEPFTGLDKPTQESLKQLLRILRDRGKLIIASHHDLATVGEIFDRVLLLNGEMIAEGPTAETLTPENIARTYNTRVFSRVDHGLAVYSFHDTFVQRSLIACALIGFTNGFLGAFVVLRRLALMADSLSHSLLPGLAMGLILFGVSPGGLFFGALCAALLVALGAQLLARGSRIKEDTALGILYTVAFSAGLVMLSFVKVRISLMHYLFGNILVVSNSDLWTTYGISLVVIPVLVALQRPLLLTLFDPTVAASQGVRVNALNLALMVCLVLTLIASLQAIGVILLLGLLIAPAATIYLLCDSYPVMLWGGGILGAVGSCAGLLISHWFDLPSGACIVLVLGLVFCLAYLLSPRYGLLPRMLRRRHFHAESLARWPEKGEVSREP